MTDDYCTFLFISISLSRPRDSGFLGLKYSLVGALQYTAKCITCSLYHYKFFTVIPQIIIFSIQVCALGKLLYR